MLGKRCSLCFMLLICFYSFAQEASEIYLFDLIKKDSTFYIKNPVNISKNEGYDNQPSFIEDGTAILFSSFRNGQMDIARYDIEENYRTWITNTEDSEFSPQAYPDKKKYFTCVRLNTDGSQFLYKYAYKKKEPEVLIPNLTVGYYLWFDKKSIITFVLGDVESLQVSNFKYDIKYPIQRNIGRSLSIIPATFSTTERTISFISKNHESPEIYSINPLNSETQYITDPLEGSEDLAWTPDGTIFMGKMDKIFKFTPGKDKKWTEINIESSLLVKNITRLVVSPSGTKIAIVAGE